MAQLNKMIRARRHSNLREMLLAAGIGNFNATMSIPYMYFMPRTCDPYAQGVMQLVQAIQNVLRARGDTQIEVTGWLDAATQRAIARYAGPSWGDKTWMQLLADVMYAHKLARPLAVTAPAVEATSGFDDIFYSPVALVAAGAAAWFFLRGGRRANKSSQKPRRAA